MILYFSGTGNSLAVAKQLAEETGDTAVHIADITEQCLRIQDKVIGFVFPVYFGDLPKPVRVFTEYVQFNPSAYFYGIVTCGSSAGRALYSLKQILSRKDCALAYGRKIAMVANSTPATRRHIRYPMEKLITAAETVKEIGNDIRARKKDTSQVTKHWYHTLFRLGPLQRLGEKWFTVRCDTTLCIHCGICENVCPSHNIHIDESGLTIGKQCSYCLACAHWCPQQAITIRNRHILLEDQYHHPNVTLKDMIRR